MVHTTSTKATRSPRPGFRCRECGWTTVKWVGRCGECQEWNTLEEVSAPSAGLGALGRRSPASRPAVQAPSSPALPVGQVPLEASSARPTGIGELDRVLGGGLVPGAVILVAGEPGVGKSTLLLDVAATLSRPAETRPVLYVSGEESVGQVRLRAERTGSVTDSLYLAAAQELPTVLGHVEAVEPSLLIVDSVQTLVDPEVEGAAGGTAQVRAVTGALIGVAKERGTPVLLVGHVTKDGAIAGPRTLEHLVDVVLQIEGDRHTPLRMVRAVKNRYGATDEVGCFEMVDEGIVELPDPSGLFLSGRADPVPGTCVTVSLEGRRPLPVEIQALVVTGAEKPRRTTSGVDFSRVQMTLAVLHAHAALPLLEHDVYVSTVGGARAMEPAVDLATALAIASSTRKIAIRPATIAFGEVGLAGDVRAVAGLRRRLVEAARLGFTDAIVPAKGSDVEVPGLRIHPVRDLHDAVRTALVRLRAPSPHHGEEVTPVVRLR